MFLHYILACGHALGSFLVITSQQCSGPALSCCVLGPYIGSTKPESASTPASAPAPPSDLLLGSYVDLHGRSLSLLLQRSVGSTNWLHAQPPRAPRPVCDLLLERLGRCEAELSRLVDASGRGAGPGGLLACLTARRGAGRF